MQGSRLRKSAGVAWPVVAVLAIVASSCAAMRPEPPATADPAPPADPTLTEPLDFLPPTELAPVFRADGSVVLPPLLAEYIMDFGETAEMRTEYMAAELHRQIDAWRATTAAERSRAAWYRRAWLSVSDDWPWYLPTAIGTAAGVAAGVYLGVRAARD